MGATQYLFPFLFLFPYRQNQSAKLRGCWGQAEPPSISSNVRDTIDKLKLSIPVILQEAECVAHAAKESVEMASAAIDNVSSGVIDMVAAFKKDTSAFTTYFYVITDVVQTIKDYESENKKNRWYIC